MKEKLLWKAVRKCRIKTPIRALGIEVALSKCTGKTVMDNFRCLNSSFFQFCNKTREKKNYGARTLTDEPPLSPYTSQYAFS